MSPMLCCKLYCRNAKCGIFPDLSDLLLGQFRISIEFAIHEHGSVLRIHVCDVLRLCSFNKMARRETARDIARMKCARSRPVPVRKFKCKTMNLHAPLFWRKPHISAPLGIRAIWPDQAAIPGVICKLFA